MMSITVAKHSLVAVGIIAFFAMFVVMTMICTAVWEYTAADLYDCTDSVPLDYLSPGG